MNHQTGEEFHSPSDKGQPVDYGYIGRLPRPDGRGTFLYLAGIHAMGTLGVAQYLEDHLDELYREVKEPPVLPARRLHLRARYPHDQEGRRADADLPQRGRGLMRVATASEAGNPTSPNEDWAMASENLIVVLDGATARTGTGCTHGIAWYAAKLGSALAGLATDRDSELANALMYGIRFTADQHRDTCDLSHPGTPSAATAMLRLKDTALEYLVLGDVTVLIDTADSIQVITDDRVDKTARAERDEADRHPFGSAEKQAALLRMKHAELAARNQPGGYWVAAADPFAAQHAITGEVPLDNVRRVAVLTDGAARPVALFGLLNWPDVLDVLEQNGPTELIRRVRAIEAADPSCMKWARNKSSDDATAVYAA